MKPDQSIAIMKALADRSRLAIANSLLEQPQYVEEIARRHGLAASTVSFHLRKLEQAGLVSSSKEQYYTVFSANDELFSTTLRTLVVGYPVGRELQDRRMEEYRRKVLGSFFRNGRLEKLPAQQKKRLIVLQRFAALFEPGRRYDEQQVSALISPLFSDYCTIRRLLVDEGLVTREGAVYWRSDDAVAVPSPLPLPSSPKAAVRQANRRTELKRAYAQLRPQAGIYQLRNRANGRIYVNSSQNLEGTRNSRLFQLKMGKAIFSRALQEDLGTYGADNFEFSVLAVLEQPEADETVEQTLAALLLHWQEKLQPFGTQGYNNARAFQRERERLQRQLHKQRPEGTAAS